MQQRIQTQYQKMKTAAERLPFGKYLCGPFVRFVAVGVLATGIHYGIYLLLRLWIPVSLAYTAGYAVSLACNFLLSARFTFRTGISLRRGAGFAVSHLINWLLHLALLTLFLRLGLPEPWAPVPVFAVAVPVNFLLVRTVFRRL